MFVLNTETEEMHTICIQSAKLKHWSMWNMPYATFDNKIVTLVNTFDIDKPREENITHLIEYNFGKTSINYHRKIEYSRLGP